MKLSEQAKFRVFWGLFLIGAVLIYIYNWWDFIHHGIVRPVFTLAAPVAMLYSVAFIIRPRLYAQPRAKKDEIINGVLGVIGFIFGLANYYLMTGGISPWSL